MRLHKAPSLNIILRLIDAERYIGSDLLEKLDTVGFFRDITNHINKYAQLTFSAIPMVR